METHDRPTFAHVGRLTRGLRMVLVPPGRSPSVGACGGEILMALSNLPHWLHERCIHYSHSDYFQMPAANRPPAEEGPRARFSQRLRSVIG